ncbi:hypothetical protein PInf_018511 [Phytophthora infestans]|nr:hypothetical protein PInf_018511 [Phytophthora infestans]
MSTVADDIAKQLEHEGSFERKENDPTSRETAGAAKAPVHAAAARRGTKRTKRAVAGQGDKHEQGDVLVELRRRKRSYSAGQYVLEYELRSARVHVQARGRTNHADDGSRWYSVKEYETLFTSARVVEDFKEEEGVPLAEQSPGRDKDGEPTKGDPVPKSVTSAPGRLAQSLSAKLATKRASESEQSELKSTTSGLCDEKGEEAKKDELSDLTSTETSTKAVTDALLCVYRCCD